MTLLSIINNFLDYMIILMYIIMILLIIFIISIVIYFNFFDKQKDNYSKIKKLKNE